MNQLSSGQFEHSAFGRDFESSYSQYGDYPGHREGSFATPYRSEPAAGGSEPNVGETERVLSVAAGLGLGLVGLSTRGIRGLALLGMGAGLVWRGYSGRCQCYAALGMSTARRKPSTAVPAQQGCKLERTIAVDRSPAELYQFWRHFENLPRVMRHLKNVETIDGQRSHWRAEGALGKDVEWDAEIINDVENERIGWRSLHDADVDHAGSVEFEPVGNGRASRLTVTMQYAPLVGRLGTAVAKFIGQDPEFKIADDLQRFKESMEAGKAASSTL